MNIFIKSVLIKAATPFSPLLKKFPNIIWKIRYCKDYKKFPNLKKPQSFMEKILWLSLYSDTSMWSKLADKYRVREYVIDRCGEQYVNKIYGIYNSAIEIDYSLLPKSFVLKTTNSCATNIIVKDKNILNIKETNHKLNKWLKFPYGELTGQLHYTQIEPLIIAEKFMEQTKKSEQSLIDYKFFCFNGVPKYVVIYSDREENTHNYSVMVYDMDWNAYHIGEFYLREISDRFRKAAFIADFKKKSYSWVQETVGKLYCIALPEGYYPHTVNYLFTIHVACTDLYLLEGYSETSNQPTFFELDI